MIIMKKTMQWRIAIGAEGPCAEACDAPPITKQLRNFHLIFAATRHDQRSIEGAVSAHPLVHYIRQHLYSVFRLSHVSTTLYIRSVTHATQQTYCV